MNGNANGSEPFLFKVNLGGMIDILSNHLYSSPDVFIRELLQNGVDALSARKSAGFPSDENGGAITVILEERDGNCVLKFCDYGTGLTEEEIHRFLAVIGQSSKHNEAQQKENNDYIGRFGIGLLSCFLVSDEICVRTRSVKLPDRTFEWRGKPDGTYTITECKPLSHCGTEVILTPKSGSEDYFTAEKITALVQYYGMPLPYPVYLSDGKSSEKIRLNPPFPTGRNAREQIMALGRMMFGCEFLDYIPLESKKGLFSGVAFILSEEVAPTAKQMHRIYLKNMLLTEDGGRLLPKWTFFLRCFINTNGLRPTASREDFYEDDTLLEAREELSDCIIAYLQKLSVHNSGVFQRLVRTHRLAVSSVAVEDDSLYKAFFPYLPFETSFGTVTGRQLADYEDDIVYANYTDEFRQVSSIFLARGKMLVNAGYTYVRQLLDRLGLLNPSAEVSALKMESIDGMLYDPEGVPQETVNRFSLDCGKVLESYECAAVMKRFEPPELPVLYTVTDEALTLRDIKQSMEKSDDMFSQMLNAFAEEYETGAKAKLYFNSENPLVKRLMYVEDNERLKCCVEILYVQALLTGGYPMHSNELQVLNENLLQLLDWSI